MENLQAFAEAVGRDIKDLQTRTADGSGGGLVNTGWVTLSEYAKIKRFGDVVTLDLKLPTTAGTVLGTIPAEMFRVGETALNIPVNVSGRAVRYVTIATTGEMKISGTAGGSGIRTQVTLMA